MTRIWFLLVTATTVNPLMPRRHNEKDSGAERRRIAKITHSALEIDITEADIPKRSITRIERGDRGRDRVNAVADEMREQEVQTTTREGNKTMAHIDIGETANMRREVEVLLKDVEKGAMIPDRCRGVQVHTTGGGEEMAIEHMKIFIPSYQPQF
jgi:hypothetical protein